MKKKFRNSILTILILFILNTAVGGDPVWHFSIEKPLLGKTRLSRLWLPLEASYIRGLMIVQDNWMDPAFVADEGIREALSDAGLGLLYLESGSFSLTFPENPDGEEFLSLLADFAELSGVPELEYCPWLPVGHSASGPRAEVMAFWKPERTVAVIHYKSGNLNGFIPDGYTSDRISNVPFLAVNGQFEEYGPNGNHSAGDNWQEQWKVVQTDLTGWRAIPGGNQVAQLIEPGAGHFSWTGRLNGYLAEFIKTAAKLRIPAGAMKTASVPLNIIPEAAGWLTSNDPYSPSDPAAASFDEYTGNKAAAWWHLSQSLAESWVDKYTDAFPEGDQDGSVRRIFFSPEFGSADKSTIPGSAFNKNTQTITVSGTSTDSQPVNFALERGPAEQTGEATFRINAAKYSYKGRNPEGVRVAILAYQNATGTTRYAERTGDLQIFTNSGKTQSITFPALVDVTWRAEPITLSATASSKLPIDYTVISGPAKIVENELILLPIPRVVGVSSIPVIVNAGQFGNSTFATATSVSRTFDVLLPVVQKFEIIFTEEEGKPVVTLDWSSTPRFDASLNYSVEKSGNPDSQNWSVVAGPELGLEHFSEEAGENAFYRVLAEKPSAN